MRVLFVFAVLVALLATVEARGSVFVLECQQPTGTSNNYRGTFFAYVSTARGQKDDIDIFGFVNVAKGVSDAYLAGSAGARYYNLTWSSSSYTTVVYGHARLNGTTNPYLHTESLYLHVFINGTEACNGYFYFRPVTYITYLSSLNVVPATTGQGSGLAVSRIYSPLTTISADLTVFPVEYDNSRVYKGRVVYDAANGTSAATYGPSTQSETGALLYTLNKTGPYEYYTDDATYIASTQGYFNRRETYMQVFTTEYPNGLMRGTNFPLAVVRRYEVPFLYTNQQSGSYYTGSFGALSHASQTGSDNAAGRSIFLHPDPTTGIFDAWFDFQFPVRPGNQYDYAAFLVSINAKAPNNKTWNFDYYNWNTESWVVSGFFASQFWLPGRDLIAVNPGQGFAYEYLNKNGVLRYRVYSQSGLTPSEYLRLDQFAIAPYTAAGPTTQQYRNYIKEFKVAFNF